MSVTTVVGRMTREEAQILAHYSAGETSRQIVQNTGIDLQEVGLVLDSLAGNNRERARELTLSWQQRAKTNNTPGPGPVPAQPKPPVITVAEPAPPKVYERNIDSIADMLQAAQDSGNGRLERAVEKIRGLLTELQEQLAEHSREEQLRDEQAQLEARLAEIRAALKPKRASVVSAIPAGTPVIDPKAVRAWAANSGIDCPTHGRVPAAVVAAYQKAVEA